MPHYRLVLVYLALLSAMSASAFLFAGADRVIPAIVYGALLIPLAVIDFQTLRLPNWLNAALVLAGLVYAFIQPSGEIIHHILGGIIGYVSLFIVEVSYKKLKGIQGLGRGDAKLLGGIGLWTAWQGLPIAVLIASVSALCYVLIVYRRPTRQTKIAFGPWLALGGWSSFLLLPFI